MDNLVEIPKAAQGKRIVLGETHREFALPGDKVLMIRRMPMTYEIRFVESYNGFVKGIKEVQAEVLERLQQFMGGASSVQFGLMEGLEMVGDLFGKLPAFQQFAIEGVMLIAEAQKTSMGKEYLMDNLSTADCLEILGAQAEVQGLLGCFRGVLAGLGAPSGGQG